MTYEQKSLLRRAAEMAVKEYKHFDMGYWRVNVTKTLKKAWAKMSYKRAKLDCGTVCCLAGNVCIVALGIKAFEVMTKDAIEPVAAGLLGMSTAETCEIFAPDGRFYDEAGRLQIGTLKYAKAVQAGVENFIAEKEAA